MSNKIHLKKGDKAIVISGNYKGKLVDIVGFSKDKSRVEVSSEESGFKYLKKHYKPQSNNKFPEGGIKDMNPKIHISNLMLIDPTDNKPTKVKRDKKEVEISGKKKLVSVRVSKRTNKEI